MPPLSFLEISRSALLHNTKLFRKRLNPKTQLVAVIKGNAYGHGQNEIATIIEPHVDAFQLDDIEELFRLRKISRKRTLVLGYIAKNDISEAVRLQAEIAVYDTARLPLIETAAKKFKATVRIHLKIDALLGRQGILPHETKKFLTTLKRTPHLELASVYSHFSNIEDTADLTHAQHQITTFENAVQTIRKSGFPNIAVHLAATSGVLTYPKLITNHTLVRLGIGLYGLWPSESLRRSFETTRLQLQPVLRWITHIAQIKSLPPGHPIGYGLTYITGKKTTVAIIPQGYSDGYDRGLSNIGTVLIHGTRCPILGRIAMNMFAVNITHLQNPRPEDEVVLLGTQKKERITAEEIAAAAKTINYEIVTRISPFLPRHIV